MSDLEDPDTNTETRTRKLTERGREYNLQLSIRRRKRTYKQWRKQVNRSEAILLDAEDLSSLRRERNELEACFNTLTTEQEQLEDELSDEEDKDNISTEYDRWEKEYQIIFKALNGRIAALLSDEDERSSTKSSRRSCTSRSSASSTRSYGPRQTKIVKAARLDTELKFYQLESAKEIALKKQQNEIEMLKKRKELAVTRAEIKAIDQVEREDASIPPSENGEDDLLDNYLNEQFSETKETPPPLHGNENETERKEMKEYADTSKASPPSANDKETETTKEDASGSTTSPSLPNDTNGEREIKARKDSVGTLTTTLPSSHNDKERENEVKPKIDHSISPSSRDYNERKPEVKSTNEQPCTSTPMSVNNDALSRLADLLSQRQRNNELPRPEPDVFNGDLLRFPLWMKSFETLVESRATTPSERLYYLGRYTTGEAKEAIVGLLPLNTEQAYSKAKKLLRNRFGNTFLISDAYRRRLNDWPKVPSNDGPGLRKFSDFLEHCKAAMEEMRYLNILDDPDENQRMLKKLPSYLVARWGRIVDRWITTEDHQDEQEQCIGYPPFKEFCKFIQTEARIACNPVTSLRHLKDDYEKAKTSANMTFRKRTAVVNSFATGVKNESDQTTPRETKQYSSQCPLCERDTHDLDFCRQFSQMTLDKRKEFVRREGLCWGCLRGGHKNRYCRNKKTCKACEGPHPSSLHDHSYKADNNTSKPREGSPEKIVSNRVGFDHTSSSKAVITSHSLIVPVFLRHKDNPDKELMVYALLDEQSDACFIKDSTLKDIGVDGPEVNIQLSTVLGQQTIQSKKITGLSVKGAREMKEIPLPKVYTRENIPAKRGQIPRPETALRWPHLERIANDLMPYRSDVDIGILIGLNCAGAIKPHEVIPGKDDEPYAKRTALGWGIIGIVDVREYNGDDNSTETLVNQTIVKEVKVKQDKMVCRFAFQTQVKEVLNPQQVYRMFEMDFNERETDQKSLSHEDRRFLKIMTEEIHQLYDGHYEMPLPLKTDGVPLENNVDMAMKRLVHLKKRFQNDPQYRQDYVVFMKTIIDSGHAERVPEDEKAGTNGKVWYIPHHGVYHPKKPGKIRVVFDCSATYKGQSLNKQLLQGPDLTNNLVGVLCRFRQESVAFMCDIEKMFHQVKVNTECRDYLRFLWWEDGDIDSQPKEFRMTVHLFGAVSSPGCANFGLNKVADDYKDEFGSETAQFIKEDFYVDDGLKSVPTAQDAIRLIKNTKDLCGKGGFHLHKFVSNSKSVIESVPQNERAEGKKNLDVDKDNVTIERALGVQWCVESDTFQFRITLKDRPFTRRGILATVSSVFDPLGMVAPVILLGKKILQTLCQDGVEWDDRIPDELRPKWEKWRSELHALTELKVSRCYKPPHIESLKTAELHHFSDASNSGYGQCSYLRLIDVKDQVHCALVMAKSRVTPQKPITIPRLELSAALVSVKVSTLLRNELNHLFLSELFWTDSQVVLGYIYNEARRFHTFVANRVQQIRDRTAPDQWHYVDTKGNPADHASRGLTAKELVECDAWWNGPKFLWTPSAALPKPQEVPHVTVEDPEVKKQTCLATKVDEYPSILKRLEYFSGWHRAKKAIALCLRLRERLKNKDNKQPKELTKPMTRSQSKQTAETAHCKKHALVNVNELQSAEQVIIKALQREHFNEEIQVLSSMGIQGESSERSTATQRNRALRKESCLYRLDPFLDEDGLLRVGGRLKLADIPYYERHPLILPKESHVTSLILCHFHDKVHHQGRGITQNEIRASGYWTVGGKSVISHHISKCIKCRKLRSKTQVQKMADLPKDRLQPAPPFTYSGVDCFGPWLIKEGRREVKRYGVLFTCMASRAIHIEVASSMETDSFINAYRRFVGRRGPVRQLRSDQGTNFIGAKNELQKALVSEMNNETISNELLKDNCDWVVFKFNVPHASHMGGVWERQIRSVRSVLNALLERQGTQLDDESLRTLMVEAEAIVNSRPLSTESANPTEPTRPLSPNHLLTMKSKVVLPPPGTFQRPELYSRKRWRRVQYLANEFWMKWRKTFLQSLQQRPKWTAKKRDIEVDDVVLVKDEGLPRNKWLLARVTKTIPCDDGKVRKVELAMADASADSKGKREKPLSHLQRPIHKLVLLYSNEEQRQDRGIPIEEP